MNRIATSGLKSAANEIGELIRKLVTQRVRNAFEKLRNFVAANLIEVLIVAGGAASASLTDITLAVAIAIVARLFKRLNGTLPACRS